MGNSADWLMACGPAPAGGGGGGGAIEQVGSTTFAANSSTLTLPTGLQENDFVLVIGLSDASPENFDAPDGFTLFVDTEGTGTDVSGTAAHMVASWKIMGATPESSLTGLYAATDAAWFSVAFRNVDTTTPLDVPRQGTAVINWVPVPVPSLTTVTDNCLRVIFSFLDDDVTTMSHPWDATAPVSFYSSFGSNGAGGTFGLTSFASTVAGFQSVAGFTTGGLDASVSIHMALRPANP